MKVAFDVGGSSSGSSDAVGLARLLREQLKRWEVDQTASNMAAWVETFRRLKSSALSDAVSEADPTDPLSRLRHDGLTLDELLGLQLPPKEWYVAGLIEKEAVVAIIGPPNAGKTFLGLDALMKSAAADYKVLLYEAEGSVAGLQKRLRRAEAHHRVAKPGNLRILHNPTLDLLTDDGAERVIAQAKAHGANLIVFDSLSALCAGLDENDSAAMGALANRLYRIKVATGATVLVLHHMTKEGWREGERPTLAHMRGHSALAGRVDVAFAIVPAKSFESEIAFDLWDLKQREEAKRDKPRRCTIAMVGEAATFTMLEPEGGERQPAAMAVRALQLEAEALANLSDQDCLAISATKLALQMKRRDVDVRKAVSRLIEKSLVRAVGQSGLVKTRVPPTPPGGPTEHSEAPPSSGSSPPFKGEDPGRRRSGSAEDPTPSHATDRNASEVA